ncbi:hypothetical protein MMC34_005901 [Xylographa carneopallida]|nr:hypothetical protein [Xylographa carneopallida]
MPPFIPRKRRLSTLSPEPLTPRRLKKPTLFDTFDQGKPATSISENQKFLDELDDRQSDTSLSDVNSSDFEDALPPPKRKKELHHDEEDEEVDWEDAIQPELSIPVTPAAGPSDDLELTISKDHHLESRINPHDKKKAPSKIERQIRTATHCMHVQFLLFHNLMRNAWICDTEVQKILLGHLPAPIRKEVETWRLATGMEPVGDNTISQELNKEKRKSALENRGRGRARGRANRGHGDIRSQREWGRPAERQERGTPNMSHGDPLIRLLRNLAAYWKQRFRVTAPGLRKQGYKTLAVLEQEVASFHNDRHDPEEHGERIDSLQAFRDCARTCEGSRDVGAQLFTALIRGLGLEARSATSLQPIGFGWNKSEEANMKKKKFRATQLLDADRVGDDSEKQVKVSANQVKKSTAVNGRVSSNSMVTPKRSKRRNNIRSGAGTPVSDSELSNAIPSDSSDDDDSVIDITHSMPHRKPNMNYDKDLPFPNSWTEVISPLTNRVFPVDSLLLIPPVATKQEHLAGFEPRGAKAEKAKQVFAYVVAFSADGTAKDVTTRYLKRHMWPGKTKGVRMPVEKIPILDKRGKVKHYEEYDWFKTVMSGYVRNAKMRNAVDDLEEATDLKAIKPEKKEAKEGEETLQGYKQSATYVLERHLRREEAILPGSEPVKTFVTGKGDKAKEEPVYLRKDVVVSRTSESWHKEGRKVKEGEHPMKMVPIRAVTLIRKREIEEAERDGGEKLKQGLYSIDQTEWIIPPPIQNGVIPKNAFGNMDCFVPTMVPEGAVHIPLRGTMKICKRLGIDFAEAVTGFEFGNQRAVPVITGVVIASEHEDAVIGEWEKDEEERRIKEEGKREKAALSMWRKFLMGLRIIERVQEEYGGDANGHMKEVMNPFTNRNKRVKPSSVGSKDSHVVEEALAGGFLPEAKDQDEEDSQAGLTQVPADDQEGGGFLVEDDSVTSLSRARSNGSAESIDTGVGSTTSNVEMETTIKDTKHIAIIPTTKKRSGTTSRAAVHVTKSSSKTTPLRKAKAKLKAKKLEQKETSASESESKVSSSVGASKTPARTVPERVAARKSQTSVKSHYFADSNGNDDESESESSESEDEVVSKPLARRGGRGAATNGQTPRGRRGRPRKTI